MAIQPLDLPAYDWASWLTNRVEQALDNATTARGELGRIASGDPQLLEQWNELSIQLANAATVASLLSSVHPDADVMELAEAAEVKVRKFSTDLLLDAQLYQQLQSIPTDSLDQQAQRLLHDTLRAFRRRGATQPEPTRERLRHIAARITELAQAFARNIRDGKRTAYVPQSALEQLPADYREAHQPGEDGRVAITTEYPDVRPFLAYSDDAQARRAVTHEFLNLAWPDNDAVLVELLQLRHQQATLLGYDNWADFDAEVKMIGTGGAIPKFIDQLSQAAEEAAHQELELLQQRAARDGVTTIDTSNFRYYLEAVKRERFQVDPQAAREYFDFEKVRAGLLEVTSRLFQLQYEPVTVETWHEDVASYDVYSQTQLIGRIHLDLHPRERKYNHAAQFDLVTGVRGRQLPEGVLVCNFPRGLMTHDDVVTLFHEFGHLMHHVIGGDQKWVDFSGVATEWDFVEAPSQLLEEWAWDPAVLQTFATNSDGHPIPTELVQRLRQAEEFGKAILLRTQMFYAAVSYYFHVDRPSDLTAKLQELQARYSLVEPLADTHFHTGFGHLAGYTSAYYTYAWSLVIAKDLFSAFDPDDLFAPEVAKRYRDQILAPGGAQDAADLVRNFLGRPSNNEAFSAWLSQ